MAQIFSRASDTYLRVAGIAVGLVVIGGLLLAGGLVRSDYVTREGIALAQPVPFSHRHHTGELGIDCRYCHHPVEQTATAGYPPTHTCMTCHSQLWTNADALAPVRESYTEGWPIPWNRVHDLPDFVYFNHSIHIDRGIGCSECHGAVETMNRVYQRQALHMSWCLECHRNPGPHLRPAEEVFDRDWDPPGDRAALARRLMAEFDIEPGNLDSCYICHR